MDDLVTTPPMELAAPTITDPDNGEILLNPVQIQGHTETPGQIYFYDGSTVVGNVFSVGNLFSITLQLGPGEHKLSCCVFVNGQESPWSEVVTVTVEAGQ